MQFCQRPRLKADFLGDTLRLGQQFKTFDHRLGRLMFTEQFQRTRERRIGDTIGRVARDRLG